MGLTNSDKGAILDIVTLLSIVEASILLSNEVVGRTCVCAMGLLKRRYLTLKKIGGNFDFWSRDSIHFIKLLFQRNLRFKLSNIMLEVEAKMPYNLPIKVRHFPKFSILGEDDDPELRTSMSKNALLTEETHTFLAQGIRRGSNCLQQFKNSTSCLFSLRLKAPVGFATYAFALTLFAHFCLLFGLFAFGVPF